MSFLVAFIYEYKGQEKSELVSGNVGRLVGWVKHRNFNHRRPGFKICVTE